MMRVTVLVLCMVLSPLALAQDIVTLESGKKVRGEVIVDNGHEVQVVLANATLRRVKKGDVVAIRRGKPLKSELAEKIKGAENDPLSLLEAANWGQERRGLKRDCKRLARRALALDPTLVEARKFLGQVHMDGTWHKDQKTAERAFGKKMRSQGYTLVRGAWVSKKDKRQLSKNPGLFMLDGKMKWRLVDELMKERKMIPLGPEWYRPDQKDLVARLVSLADLIHRPFHGAKRGPTTVVVSGSKSLAEKVLRQIDRTRSWFDEFFAPKGMSFAVGPRSLIVVLKDRQTYAHFLKTGKKIHGADADRVNFCLKRDSMSFGELGRVSNQDEALWLHTLVSGTGAKMMRLWGDSSFLAPPCLYVASGHLAESMILGEIRIHFAKASRYDSAAGINRKFQSLVDARKIVEVARDEDRAISFEKLFTTSLGGLTAVHEAEGIFVLQYLQEKHLKALQDFVEGRGSSSFLARFTKAFGKPPKEIQELFWQWFVAAGK